MSKVDARLEQEIRGIRAAHGAVTEERLTAKRAKDFRDSGLYELRDEAGVVVAKLFRDPESREWYEEGMPGSPQTHYIERWRGSSQAEAIATILRRRAKGLR